MDLVGCGKNRVVVSRSVLLRYGSVRHRLSGRLPPKNTGPNGKG